MLHEYKNAYEYARKMADTIHIFLVANIRDKTANYNDYSGTSVISEFLTLNQQELILESLRETGFETSCFNDEQDFINRYISDDYMGSGNGKVKLVMNSAQKGTKIGRKSLIPAFCDQYNLWHTNSNPYVVSLARNKYHSSCLLKANGLPTTTDCLYVPNQGWLLNKTPEVGEKVIAKLNYETSSIGLTSDNIFTYSMDKDIFIQELSRDFNQPVVVQNFIEGYEVEVPIINGKKSEVVLPVGITVNNEKNLGQKILDYNIRKELKFGFYNFQDINAEISKKIEDYTIQVANLFCITGFGRVDFRIDYDGNIFITDIATNPHITKGMSFYYAFKQNELSYRQMLEILIAVSIEKYMVKS